VRFNMGFNFLGQKDEEQPFSLMDPNYVAPESVKPIDPVVLESLKQRHPASFQTDAPVEAQSAIVPQATVPSEYDNFKSEYGADKYKQAQAAAEEGKSGLGWAQFAAGAGDAIAGRSPSESAKTFENIRKGIDEKTTGAFEKKKAAALQDISTKKSLEGGDPNSQKSKVVQNTISKLWGDKFTPEQIAKVTADDADLIYKPMELKSKLEQTAATQQMLHEDRQIKNEALRNSMKDKASAKVDEQDKKDAKALEDHLAKGWVGRSGQAGQVQGTINSAERAEQLIDQGKNQKGGLDARQIEELAQSAAKMLGGGATASARVDALVPHTFLGRAQSLKEWASNSPQGAEQQAFVDRIAETVAREKALAQQQQKQYQIEGLPSHTPFKKRNPELYNAILQSKGIDDSLIDQKGRYKSPPVQSQSVGEKPRWAK